MDGHAGEERRGEKVLGDVVEYQIVEDDWATDLPQNPNAQDCPVYMKHGGCEYAPTSICYT